MTKGVKGTDSRVPKPCKSCGKEMRLYPFMLDRKNYCSRTCMGLGYRQTPEQFWAKVDRRGPDECWPWKASVFNKKHPKQMGYGRNAADGKFSFAHRSAWIHTYGDIPDGLIVMHTCDNPLCCNIAHLRLGTQTENMQDMVAKGRKACGERHRSAKLTDEKVREILREYKAENKRRTNARELASRYGVRVGAVCAIVRGDTWKHIDRPNKSQP